MKSVWLFFSKTVWGAVLAVLGYLLQPEVLNVLPQKVAAVITGIGVILGAIGLRDAIKKEGVNSVAPMLLFALAFLSAACTTANASTPRVTATIETVSDTTIRVITRWGYKVQPTDPPDSTRVKVGVGSAPPSSDVGHFVRWPKTTDTSMVAIAAYGTIQGYSCVVPHRRATWGSQTCANWQYVRPDVAPPAYDSVGGQIALLRLDIRPVAMQVDADSGARCAKWQQANPSKSVWVMVNVQAVSACTGSNGAPTVAQFCAFYMLKDSTTGITENSRGSPYCLTQYDSWKREVGV